MPNKITAVIVNWNLPNDTIACVRHLRNSISRIHEIVVVDNGSRDDSVQRLHDAFPDLEVLSLPENRGFAAGSNAGIRRALETEADWILLVNNDAVLAVDTVSQLVAAGETERALVMPRIDVLPAGRLWHAGARNRRWVPLPSRLTERDIDQGQIQDIDYVVGCVLLVHREVFERIGLFDETYFMYYEDLDFSIRARRAGYHLLVVPSALAWHRIGASLNDAEGRRAYLQTRQKTIWCRAQPFGVAALAWWASLALRVVWLTGRTLSHGKFCETLLPLRAVYDGLDQARRGLPSRPV